MKYFAYCRKSTESEERQVLSLLSQQEALQRSFGDRADISIVDFLTESMSAKGPGRPVFTEMLARVEAGEADGILSWAPDRLARNSIDGGRVIYLLDTGALLDLKFATYTFENNSQGKFMLSIMFGQSKYYSDALSENVKRGNRTKLERGWRPNRAPLGYLNDPATRTIAPDPLRFPLIRQMFELVLSERYNPREIGKIAIEQWGFLTPRSKRSGARPIGRSTVYKILRNPFYKGVIVWKGASFPGQHTPVVPPEVFDRVQVVLSSSNSRRESELPYAFRGLIQCGTCARTITVERTRNRYGTEYLYYHCSARSLTRQACGEKSIEAGELCAQVRQFLASLTIPNDVAEWAVSELERSSRAFEAQRTERAASYEEATRAINSQLKELTSLRIRQLIGDEEFSERRCQLESERDRLGEAAASPDPTSMIEPLSLLVRFSNQAVDWFDRADSQGKSTILKMVCSNLCLSHKRVSFEAAKPFTLMAQSSECLRQRGVVEPVRTFKTVAPEAAGRALLTRLREVMSDAEAPFHKLPELLTEVGVPPDTLPPCKPPRRKRSDAGERRGPQQRRRLRNTASSSPLRPQVPAGRRVKSPFQ